MLLVINVNLTRSQDNLHILPALFNKAGAGKFSRLEAWGPSCTPVCVVSDNLKIDYDKSSDFVYKIFFFFC